MEQLKNPSIISGKTVIKQTGKNEDELKNYIQAFAKRKFHAQYRKEMNRSVKKMIESWK